MTRRRRSWWTGPQKDSSRGRLLVGVVLAVGVFRRGRYALLDGDDVLPDRQVRVGQGQGRRILHHADLLLLEQQLRRFDGEQVRPPVAPGAVVETVGFGQRGLRLAALV